MSIDYSGIQMLTPNDIKQEISFLFVHALATRLGYSFERTCIDRDSIDATICAKGKLPGSKGVILSPKIDVQLKATEQECSGIHIPFKISKKNYDDLRQNAMVPRVLVVIFLIPGINWVDYDVEKISLYGKGFWVSLKGMDAIENISDKTIYLNQTQRLTDEVIQQWMVSAANREELSHVLC